MDNDEVVYFEFNNWEPGKYYPDEEPFTDWLDDDCRQAFCSANWIKKNKLVVVTSLIDMSINYCITAPKSWVEQRCPKLLTEFTQFLRPFEEDKDEQPILGMFGNEFLPYTKENIGLHHQYLKDGEWVFDEEFVGWDDNYDD